MCASGIQDKPAEFLEKTPDPPDKFSVEFAEDGLPLIVRFLLAQAALRDLGALDKDQPDGLTPRLGGVELTRWHRGWGGTWPRCPATHAWGRSWS